MSKRCWMSCWSSSRGRRSNDDPNSRHDLPDHLPMHIRQPPVDSAVANAEALVVDAEQGEDGGVLLVAHGRIVTSMEGEFVAGAIAGAAFDPAAGQPAYEGV